MKTCSKIFKADSRSHAGRYITFDEGRERAGSKSAANVSAGAATAPA